MAVVSDVGSNVDKGHAWTQVAGFPLLVASQIHVALNPIGHPAPYGSRKRVRCATFALEQTGSSNGTCLGIVRDEKRK